MREAARAAEEEAMLGEMLSAMREAM